MSSVANSLAAHRDTDFEDLLRWEGCYLLGRAGAIRLVGSYRQLNIDRPARMNCHLLRFAILAFCPLSLVLIPAITNAQVNGPGPSDPALFNTVINLPPDPDIDDEQKGAFRR